MDKLVGTDELIGGIVEKFDLDGYGSEAIIKNNGKKYKVEVEQDWGYCYCYPEPCSCTPSFTSKVYEITE